MSHNADSQLFADDLTIGQTFVGEPREIGDAAFKAFAELTGDHHPIHYDDAYAAKTRFGKRLAHGLLVMSMTAFGATDSSRRFADCMVAFLGQDCRFLKPVFVGDVLTSHFKISSIERKVGSDAAAVQFDVELVNGGGDIVLIGHHRYLLLCRQRGSQENPHVS